MDTDSGDRTLQDLRTIVEKVEQKAHVPPDNFDNVSSKVDEQSSSPVSMLDSPI
jgi:hypothetical protein